MPTEKAEKILSVAKDFGRAAMMKQDTDMAFEERFIDAAMENGVDIMEQLGIAMEFAKLKHRLGDDADGNDRYRELAIQLAEFNAVICASFCTDEELAAMLPEGANDPEVVEALEEEGAPQLSGLCARLG